MHIRFKFYHASTKAPNDSWNYFHCVTFLPPLSSKQSCSYFLIFSSRLTCLFTSFGDAMSTKSIVFILQCKIRPSRSTVRSHPVLPVPIQSLSSIFQHFSFLPFFRIPLCSFWHYPLPHCPLNHQNFEYIVVAFDIF